MARSRKLYRFTHAWSQWKAAAMNAVFLAAGQYPVAIRPGRTKEVVMKSSKRVFVIVALLSSMCLTLPPRAAAQDDDFYQGKAVRIVVGLSAGGGYDRAARLLARYMGKYIPGRPEIIVQNMPGAGSVIAANFVYNVAKPDGLTLLMPHNNIYLNQLAGSPEVKFDLRKFNWIGAAEKDDMMMFARRDAPFKSVDDVIKAKEAPRCGSTGVGSSDYVMSRILEETVGAKFNNVLGYPGSSEIALALERGEVMCMGLTISTFFTREPFLSWQKKNFIRFIAQSGRQREERVPDAPTIYELMDQHNTPATSRRVAEAMLSGGEWARSMLAPPGTAPERVGMLRAAYEKTLNDPELVAEAKKGRVEIVLSQGDELQALAAKVMEQSPEVIEKIRQLFVQ
jgi:tripartite-type tricarboxylate transporter receptor subunit TctC